MCTSVRPLQLENALIPIDVTLLGIVTDVRPEQSSKVKPSIDVTLLGIVTDVRLEQQRKASLPIEVTQLGIVTEVSPEQPQKTEHPIDVTLSPKIYSFTWLPKIFSIEERELYDLDVIALLFKVTLVSLEHLSKAPYHTDFTLSGMVISVSPEQ